MRRSIVLATVGALVASLVTSCGRDWTDREYCVRRQMAWESAFPALPQTAEQRTRFVDDCIRAAANQHVNGQLDRSIACMKQHIFGKGYAREEYLAFAACEGTTPTATDGDAGISK